MGMDGFLQIAPNKMRTFTLSSEVQFIQDSRYAVIIPRIIDAMYEIPSAIKAPLHHGLILRRTDAVYSSGLPVPLYICFGFPSSLTRPKP